MDIYRNNEIHNNGVSFASRERYRNSAIPIDAQSGCSDPVPYEEDDRF
jgi:hypothetical protein